MATKPSIFKAPTIGGLLGAFGTISAGIETFRTSKIVARDLRVEGEVIFAESQRTANIIIEEGIRFAANQSLQYLGAGVHIAGSALVTLAQTRKFAKAEADAVRTRGATTKNLAESKAKTTEREGRASLVSGVIGGVSSIFI